MKKKKVAYVHCGGTIASIEKKNKRTELIQSPEELLETLFRVKSQIVYESLVQFDCRVDNVDFKDFEVIPIRGPFVKFSEDVTFDDLNNLNRQIAQLLKDRTLSGIIVSQGTDNLTLTAQYNRMSITGRLPCPVMHLGAAEPLDSLPVAYALYFIDKMPYNLKNFGTDVYIVDFRGRRGLPDDRYYRSLSSYLLNHNFGFETINYIPPFYREDWIRDEDQEIMKKERRIYPLMPSFNPKFKLEEKFDQRVKVIRVNPFLDPSEITSYKEKGCRGLIIEAPGSGNGPDSMNPYISDSIKAGGTAVVTSQSPGEKVEPIYKTSVEWHEMGVIFTGRTLTSVAHIKLGKALAYTNNQAKIYRVMSTNCLGENSTASLFNNFSWSSLEK